MPGIRHIWNPSGANVYTEIYSHYIGLHDPHYNKSPHQASHKQDDRVRASESWESQSSNRWVACKGQYIRSEYISHVVIYLRTWQHFQSSNLLDCYSSLEIRRDLQWLPVSHRITFKLCLLTWKTLHTAHPPYLSELITQYLPPRALRSFNTNFLARPTGIISNFTSRAFSVSAPSIWNSLPTHIRSLDKLSTFERQLKSHLFQSAFAA